MFLKNFDFRRLFVLLPVFLFSFSAFALSVSAQSSDAPGSVRSEIRKNLKESNLPGTSNIAEGEESQNQIIDIVFNVVKIVLGVLGVIALLLILYSGFLWMTAGGNAEQIKKAKGIMKNGAIGLAIVLASYGITAFVIENIVNVTTPADEVGFRTYSDPRA